MGNTGLLRPLTDALEDIRRRMADHGNTLRQHETRTRRSLIDPLLDSLGWDTQDPSQVVHEHKAGNGRADYALMRPDGKPLIAIEAKRLGEPLESHIIQMVTYANVAGIPYCGLTDGNVWEVYDVFAQTPIEEKRLLRANISSDPLPATALALTLLWRPGVTTGIPAGTPARAAAPLLEWKTQAEITQLKLPTDSRWMPLTEFDQTRPEEVPKRVRFPDGTEKDLANVRELIIETAAWLHRSGSMGEDRIPIKNGRKRNLVERDINPDRDTRERYRTLPGTQLRVYVNLSRANCRKAVIRLATICGEDPARIAVA